MVYTEKALRSSNGPECFFLQILCKWNLKILAKFVMTCRLGGVANTGI